MSLPSWLAKLFPQFTGSRRSRRKVRHLRLQPSLEVLEVRMMPATLIVNSTADNTTDASHLTLRDAIMLVNNAGNTSFLPGGWSGGGQISGTYGTNDTIDFSVTGTLTLAGTELPQITKNVAIVGPGASSLAISGNNASRVFDIASGKTVSISGLTIDNGNAGSVSGDVGGAIRDSGTLSLINSTITGNSAYYGGAITNYGPLTLTNCTVSSNTATYTGGIFSSHTQLTLTNSTVTGNTNTTAANGVGGIYDSVSTLTLTNSSVSNNIGGYAGGIDNGSSSTLVMTDSTVSGNTATHRGGGIYNAPGATITATDSSIVNNTVTSTASGARCFGAGIFDQTTANVTLTDSTVTGNGATVNGSGYAGIGGGIDMFLFSGAHGNLTLTNSVVAGNTASGGTNSAGPDIDGAVTTDNGYNVVGTTSGSSGLTGSHDTLNVTTLVWNGGASGTWSTSTTDWLNGDKFRGMGQRRRRGVRHRQCHGHHQRRGHGRRGGVQQHRGRHFRQYADAGWLRRRHR